MLDIEKHLKEREQRKKEHKAWLDGFKDGLLNKYRPPKHNVSEYYNGWKIGKVKASISEICNSLNKNS